MARPACKARRAARRQPASPRPRTSSWIGRSSPRSASARQRRRSTSSCTARRRRLRSRPRRRRQPPMRIIGVVEERAFSFFKTPNETAGAMYTLQADLGVTIARVAATDLDAGLAGIDAAWKQLAPNVAINRRFLDEIFERAYANYVRINHLFGTLSVMAFAICVAGLFGMAIFVAGRRRREIGVRKTLGGTTAQMVALAARGVLEACAHCKSDRVARRLFRGARVSEPVLAVDRPDCRGRSCCRSRSRSRSRGSRSSARRCAPRARRRLRCCGTSRRGATRRVQRHRSTTGERDDDAGSAPSLRLFPSRASPLQSTPKPTTHWFERRAQE